MDEGERENPVSPLLYVSVLFEDNVFRHTRAAALLTAILRRTS